VIISVNGAPREVSAGTRLVEVLDRSTGDLPRGVAVAVNGAVVPRAKIGQIELTEGARVEIVTAVQGG
jgi:sulfur carrier protein